MEQNDVTKSGDRYVLEVETILDVEVLVPNLLLCVLHALLEVVEKPLDLYRGIIAHRKHLLELAQLVSNVE